MFVAALRHDEKRQHTNALLRRQPKHGRLIIEASTRQFTIGVNGRLGFTAKSSITDRASLDGEVFLPNEGREINWYFGPGFKFYGFAPDSAASSSYINKAANA